MPDGIEREGGERVMAGGSAMGGMEAGGLDGEAKMARRG